MNKIIKFRSWNGERMFYPGDAYTDTVVLNYDAKTGSLTSVNIGQGNYEWEVNGYNWYVGIPKNELSLMQFTGLVDKNGKEIYEGDIIETLLKVRLEVVFHNGCFCVHGYNWHAHTSVVVGNIYQNPDLL